MGVEVRVRSKAPKARAISPNGVDLQSLQHLASAGRVRRRCGVSIALKDDPFGIWGPATVVGEPSAACNLAYRAFANGEDSQAAGGRIARPDRTPYDSTARPNGLTLTSRRR